MLLTRTELSSFIPFSLPAVSGVTILICQAPTSQVCPKLYLQPPSSQALPSKSPCHFPDPSCLPPKSHSPCPYWEGLHSSSPPAGICPMKPLKPSVQLPSAEEKGFLGDHRGPARSCRVLGQARESQDAKRFVLLRGNRQRNSLWGHRC